MAALFDASATRITLLDLKFDACLELKTKARGLQIKNVLMCCVDVDLHFQVSWTIIRNGIKTGCRGYDLCSTSDRGTGARE